jgi:signal peptide peptidase SppA
VNSDSWINQYLGRTGYPEIREALIHAASDHSVKTIVLDVKSGGGMVAGLPDTAALIGMIDAKVKPIHTYSDSIMASAAYWLGSSARSVSVGQLAEVGSIGVLVVHQEMSKMLEEAGITTTVIRSGKYKALGLPQEKLSALGQEVIQAQVDQMDQMFVAHVAKSRGKSEAEVQKNMAQGRVFIGQSAVDAGLVDSITNFDALISKLQAGIDKKTGGIDLQKSRIQYAANINQGATVPNALTEQAIAQILAGAATAAATAETPAEAKPEDQTAAPAAETPAAETTETGAAAQDEKATEPAKADAVVTLLQSQLSSAQAQVVALSVELQAAKVAADTAQANAGKMLPIVRAAVSNLRVAMGGTAAGVESLNEDGLLAEHANLQAQFVTKFKAGGVAAVSSNAAAEIVSKNVQDPVRSARLAATRISK